MLFSYSGTQINGLSQIVVDIPDGYVGIEIEAARIGVNAAGGTIGLRCGPAGGTLLSGASDYTAGVIQYIQGDSSVAGAASTGNYVPWAVAGTSTSGGAVDSFFSAKISMSHIWGLVHCTVWDSTYGYLLNTRSFYAPFGDYRRIGIIGTAPFTAPAAAYLRIYGVR